MTQTELVTIAKIVRTQGNRGEVVAELLTDFPTRFRSTRRVLLQKGEQSAFGLTLESFWLHKGRVILKFVGVDNISDAEALRGHEVKIPETEMVPLSEGSYYQHDLIDCVAKDPEGHEYGIITEVIDTGGHYLLRIERKTGEFLIPFAESMLVRIDVKKKEMVCSLPEGLEDL